MRKKFKSSQIEALLLNFKFHVNIIKWDIREKYHSLYE